MIKKKRLINVYALTASVPAFFAGTACYAYRPAPLTLVQPGQAVRVMLTPAGAGALASTIGPGATSLDGRVMQRTDENMVLALTQIARGPDQPEEFLQNDRLSLPLTSGSAFAVRSLDKPRTALAVGGLVAIVVAGKVFMNQPGLFGGKTTVSQTTK